MRVAVTGASGFVGSAVCRALSARGLEVTALSRTGDAVAGAHRLIAGDITHPGTLTPFVDGADVIVHAAALVRSSDRRALAAVNVGGTDALVRAACGQGVGRFVHVSTAGVHGRPGVAVDEAGPLRPLDAYERSKAQAEAVVTRLPPGSWSIVRPTDVLGAGHPHDPLVRFLGAVRSNRLCVSPRAWCNYVGVDHVAAVTAELAADDGDPPDLVFANDPMPLPSLIALAGDALGATPRFHEFPGGVARLVEPLLRRAATATPPIGRVSGLFDETRFVTRHGAWLQRAGLEPDLHGTLAAMVEDYRRRGLL